MDLQCEIVDSSLLHLYINYEVIFVKLAIN